MARKTQLYIRHKDMLTRFAHDSVRAPEEEAHCNQLYAALAPQIKALVEDRYPPKDMKVLAKYQQAARDTCIRVQGPDGQMRQFNFIVPEEDNLKTEAMAFIPFVAGDLSYHSCSRRTFLGDQQLAQDIDDYNNAIEARDKAIKEKIKLYKSLIMNSRYYEEVLEIWPAAEAIRENIMEDRQAVSILSAEAIAAIKADNAGADRSEAA